MTITDKSRQSCSEPSPYLEAQEAKMHHPLSVQATLISTSPLFTRHSHFHGMVDLFNIVAKPSFWESLALDPLMLMEQRQCVRRRYPLDTSNTHRLAQDTDRHTVMVHASGLASTKSPLDGVVSCRFVSSGGLDSRGGQNRSDG